MVDVGEVGGVAQGSILSSIGLLEVMQNSEYTPIPLYITFITSRGGGGG